MWRKRKWIIVAVVAAVVILTAGIIGGVAYAQTTSTPESTQTTPGKTFLARVAEILGIDQQKLEDAVAQAKKEMQDEALNQRLQALVEKGKITQEQADQYKQWWESRPSDFPAGLGIRGFKGFRGGFHCNPWFNATPSPTASATQ